MEIDLPGIPKKATIQKRYGTCGRPNCNKLHGPYIHAFWKENGKLQHKYIGKSFEKYWERQNYRDYEDLTGLPWYEERQLDFLKLAAKLDPFASNYLNLVNAEKCSQAWAYRKVKRRIKEVIDRLEALGIESSEAHIAKYISHQEKLARPPPHYDDGYITQELGNPNAEDMSQPI